MARARLEKTRWPGIYRRGDRWVYDWADADGKRRRATADSREDASALKAVEEDRAKNGQAAETGQAARLTVGDYALDLFGADLDREKDAKPITGRYQGRRGAIRDATRSLYRRHLELYWLPPLGRKPLAKLTAPDLARAVAGMAARDGTGYLADRSIRRIFAPIAALLATAVEEGLISHNPARDVRLPSGRDELRRFNPDEDEDSADPAPGNARALTREQLDAFLLVVSPRWRLLFELLAVTGLRISEVLALRWRDLQLDGDQPVVRVRRAVVNGVYGPPKSRHGRRDVPIPFPVVQELRLRQRAAEWHQPDDLVFPSLTGAPMDAHNIRSRTLTPAAEEAGVPWLGFHAFRHTCASMLIADGRNIVQVSRWLGHHSPAFTLTVYAHLLDDGVGGPIDLDGVTSGSRSAFRVGSVELDAVNATR
jgi:integrase